MHVIYRASADDVMTAETRPWGGRPSGRAGR